MKHGLVVDPNVFVSAAITGRGPVVQLVQAAAAGTVTLVVSPLLLQELRSVLERPKFRKYLTLAEAAEFVDALELLAHMGEDPPSVGLAQVCRDPRDDYLIYLAEHVEANLLASGDRDLGRGLANRPDYPTPNVALVKLPPDPGESVRATGEIPLPRDTVVVTLQRRPELSGVPDLAGWRVHAISPHTPTPDEIADLRMT